MLLVDDDPIVRSSLKSYFASTSDIRVIAEACDGIEALEFLRAVSIDVVVADIHMPTMDGIALLRRIRQEQQPPVFVAITALDSDSTMLEVLASGGAGYIIKSSKPQAIISAVRDAMSGGTTVSPQALKRLVGHVAGVPLAPNSTDMERVQVYHELTGVEKDVLKHLCEGSSNSEIARAMNYSESTVKKQMSKLIALFGVSSRLKLAVTIIRLGVDKGVHGHDV